MLKRATAACSCPSASPRSSLLPPEKSMSWRAEPIPILMPALPPSAPADENTSQTNQRNRISRQETPRGLVLHASSTVSQCFGSTASSAHDWLRRSVEVWGQGFAWRQSDREFLSR